jgi:hypothetical protein
MFGIGHVVQIGEAPFVAGKDCSWFEYVEDLLIARSAIGCVTRGFNRIGSVKGLVLKGQSHEIALDARHIGVRCRGGVEFIASLYLIVIERETGNAALQERGNVTGWSGNAATHVQYMLAWSVARRSQLRRQDIFMTSNRFVKRLPRVLKGKMKGTAPAPFVKDSGQIVIGIHERLIRRSAFLRGRGIVIVQGGIVVHAILYRIGTRQAFFLYKKEQNLV